MQTYRTFCALIVLVFINCTKTESTETEIEPTSVAATYALLLKNNDNHKSVFLNADLNELGVDASKGSSLAGHTVRNKDRSVLSFYAKKTDCSGTVNLYDFDADSLKSAPVFANVPDCERKVVSIAHAGSIVYLIYRETNAEKTEKSFLLIMDLDTDDKEPTVVAIEHKALQILNLTSRVFVLTLDEEDTTNKLTVLDKATGTVASTMDLIGDVQKIIGYPDGNVLLSTPKSHRIIDAATLDTKKALGYIDGIEPGFYISDTFNFDKDGRLYYAKKSGDESDVDNIPAIYDFSKSTTILYLYERFLSEEQMKTEFKVANTTVVFYDEGNDLLLVGYQKTGGLEKGGLLRIQLGENPRFLDNTDLDGIPLEIVAK